MRMIKISRFLILGGIMVGVGYLLMTIYPDESIFSNSGIYSLILLFGGLGVIGAGILIKIREWLIGTNYN
ncbi:MAG: hypothetical protein QT10_C0007G0027 [archaeon GW2011_AR19]|nr:MAG: hypothetical protein QT10_C0007G0027 [archaeon GW2011_AR19]